VGDSRVGEPASRRCRTAGRGASAATGATDRQPGGGSAKSRCFRTPSRCGFPWEPEPRLPRRGTGLVQAPELPPFTMPGPGRCRAAAPPFRPTQHCRSGRLACCCCLDQQRYLFCRYDPADTDDRNLRRTSSRAGLGPPALGRPGSRPGNLHDCHPQPRTSQRERSNSPLASTRTHPPSPRGSSARRPSGTTRSSR
jgi:hypothetical protein